MPRRAIESGYDTAIEPQIPAPAPPTLGATFGAAFRQENAVVNAIDMMNPPVYKPDPGFNLMKRLKDGGMWEDRDTYLGVQSEAELVARQMKRAKEMRDKDTMARSGWPGVALGMLAGTLDPTIFMPMVGPAKGLRAFGEAAVLAGAAGAAQEGVLQQAQETRSLQESGMAVAAQTVLGGVLGGLIRNLPDGELARLASDMATTPRDGAIPVIQPLHTDAVPPLRTSEKLLGDLPDKGLVPANMAPDGTIYIGRKGGVHFMISEQHADEIRSRLNLKPGDPTWQSEGFITPGGDYLNRKEALDWVDKNEKKMKPSENMAAGELDAIDYREQVPENRKAVAPSSVGAAAKDRSGAGGLAPGALNWMAPISPVLRNIDQERSPQLRYMASQLSDAGMKMEGNAVGRAASPGGNIESLIKTHYGRLFKANEYTDNAYSKYFFENETPMAWRNMRATVGGLRSPGKLSKAEFRSEISNAMWNGDVHAVPEVQDAAKYLRKEVFDPLFEEAKTVGLFKEYEGLVGDSSYLNRIFDHDKVAARFNWLVDTLANHYEGKLSNEFSEALGNLKARNAKDAQYLEDVNRPLEEVQQLRAQFQEELEGLRRETPEHLVALEDDIALLQKQAARINSDFVGQRRPPNALLGALRRPKQMTAREIHDELQKEIAGLKERGGQALKDYKAKRLALNARLKSLNKAAVIRQEKFVAKLQKADRLEELSLKSLNRAVRAGQRFLATLSGLSDDALDKELRRVRGAFEDAAQQYDKSEIKLQKLKDKEGGTVSELLSQGERQEARAGKLTDLTESMGQLEDLDRPAWRELVQDSLDEALAKTQGLIERRALRAERLREQAAQLDPKVFKEQLAKIEQRIPERTSAFHETFRVKGADDVDIERGVADFSEHAKKTAEETVHAILNTDNRLPVLDILQSERGPELARVLDIASSQIKDVLETDIDKLVHAYIRTLSSDIEIVRKFGSANGAEEFAKLTDEQTRAVRQVESATDRQGNPLSKEKKEALSREIKEFYESGRKDMLALIARLRHQHGLPKDPRGWAHRALRVVMNLNVLRYMGGVTIASLSDVGNVVAKHGLTNTFRDGFLPAVRGLQEIKLSRHEAKLAGTALDVAIHSRSHAIFDVSDNILRGTRLERGLEWATNKMGFFALFDFWTSAMKEITAGVVNGRLLRSIDAVMNGGAARDVQKAREYLASVNIDGEYAQKIWEQVQRGGGGKVNGVWLPNTEAWDVSTPAARQTLRAYRAALVGQIDDTIVTPGIERPLVMDSSDFGKMLFQFRSFGMSSTTKVLMSGMQQRDMALVNGTIVSLALGALSYYCWAIASGGDALDEMRKAGIGKWADEAISRSGRTGVLDEVQRFAQRLPFTQPYASFSGTRSGRREGGDLIDAALGPTFDLASKAAGVLTSADQPTQHTAHMLRQMLPMQNHFILRQGFDAVERAFHLPEKRQ